MLRAGLLADSALDALFRLSMVAYGNIVAVDLLAGITARGPHDAVVNGEIPRDHSVFEQPRVQYSQALQESAAICFMVLRGI